MFMKPLSEFSEPALVWTGKVMLEGRIAMPSHAAAAVILAAAPALPDEERDAHIISSLFRHSIATLYVSLLTADELQFDARTGHYRHDADFLGTRFLEVASWLQRNMPAGELPLGLGGSSGAAAGAIVAAAQRPDKVAAVVSIDGRTDLAIDSIRSVKAPTLLVVKDMPVLRMNREALSKFRAERRIEIIHGMDQHAVDAVVEKCVRWFADKLSLVAADAYGIV